MYGPNGEPAAFAQVIITGLSLTARANTTGKVTYADVPGGCYQVVATRGEGPSLERGETRACVTAGHPTDVAITLADWGQKTRRVIVRGIMRLYDDEVFSGSGKNVPVTVVGHVNPGSVAEVETIGQACHGHEVVVRGAKVKFTLREDGSVDVVLSAALYEGSSCKTTDKEDSDSEHIRVPADGQGKLEMKLKSTGPGGGDYAKFTLEVSNERDF